MKLKTILTLFCILCLTGVQAQEVWFDADFSTQEWLDKFRKKTGEDIRSSKENSLDLGKGPMATQIDGLIFNGGLYRLENEFTSLSGKPVKYSIRLRNKNESYIEFPKLKNAGKIYVYVRNPHPAKAGSVELQAKGKKGGWNTENPVAKWNIPGHKDYKSGAHDYILTYDINSEEPVKLRIYRNEGQFMHVLRIVVEKYSPKAE